MNPGLITTSGFFRNQSPLFTKLFTFIVYNVARVAPPPPYCCPYPCPYCTLTPSLPIWCPYPRPYCHSRPRPYVPYPVPTVVLAPPRPLRSDARPLDGSTPLPLPAFARGAAGSARSTIRRGRRRPA